MTLTIQEGSGFFYVEFCKYGLVLGVHNQLSGKKHD